VHLALVETGFYRSAYGLEKRCPVIRVNIRHHFVSGNPASCPDRKAEDFSESPVKEKKVSGFEIVMIDGILETVSKAPNICKKINAGQFIRFQTIFCFLSHFLFRKLIKIKTSFLGLRYELH
jgi:hypothetical protein